MAQILGSLLASRFEIDREAGAGGMGTVYKARDLATEQWVALKILHPHTDSSHDAKRFEREAQILSEVRHPGIVTYVAHGQAADGQHYLAMEWLEGEDLAHRLARGPLSIADSVLFLRCTAEALSAAHQRGVIHRDLKPSNIFLPSGVLAYLKLLDFGIARWLTEPNLITHTGLVIGTPEYMAPEQARGARDLTPAADIFSLGCLLYECLTGQPPFVASHIAAVLVRILFEEPESVTSRRQGVPASLAQLVHRMLAKVPGQRPADASAILAELAALGPIAPEAPSYSMATTLAGPTPKTAQHEQVVVSIVLASAQKKGGDRPSSTRDTISAAESVFRDALRGELLKLNVRAEWLVNDVLVAIPSGAEAATDNATLAARSALLIKARWADAAVAISTGRSLRDTQLPVGDVVQSALRMLELDIPADSSGSTVLTYPSQRVWLDELSARLLSRQFTVHRLESLFLLTGEELDLDDSRPLLGRSTSCMGREQELGMLESLLASCIDESEACAVLITASAGVGKSRLRHEFLRRMKARGQELMILLGRADLMSKGASYVILSDALRRLCCMADAKTAEEQRMRLSARIGQHVPRAEQQRIEEFLAELCAIPSSHLESIQLRAARNDPRLMSDQIERAFLDFLRFECAAHPVLLVLEDLHWADALTIRLVDRALDALRELPLMVVALARPEIRDNYSRLWHQHSVKCLPLAGLSRKACERLILQALGAEVHPELVARLVNQAQGNGLFLEELIRAVAEGNADAVPDTVVAMLQARIGRLDAGARLLARAGSIFGETFWLSGVQALLGDTITTEDMASSLAMLLDAELVKHHPESRFPGEVELGFRHALTREAASGLIVERDKIHWNGLAARWLQRSGESSAVRVAEHYERGGELENASRQYLVAAEQALAQNGLNAAIECSKRGQACGATGPFLGELLAVEIAANTWLWHMDTVMRLAPTALKLLPSSSRHVYVTRAFHCYGQLLEGNMSEATESVQIIIALNPDPTDYSLYIRYSMMMAIAAVPFGAREICHLLTARSKQLQEHHVELDIHAAAWVLHGEGTYIRGFQADPWKTWWLANAAADGHQAAGDRMATIAAELLMGPAACELGNAVLGVKTLKEAAAHADKAHSQFYHRQAVMHLGAELAKLPSAEAWQQAEECVRQVLAEPSTPAGYQGWAHGVLAQCLLQRQRWPQAEAEANLALAQCQTLPLRRLWVQTLLATCLVGLERPSVQLAQTILVEIAGLGGAGYAEVAARLTVAEVFYAVGEIERARTELRETLRQIQLRAERIPDDAWRGCYLNHVPENLKAKKLAQKLLADREFRLPDMDAKP